MPQPLSSYCAAINFMMRRLFSFSFLTNKIASTAIASTVLVDVAVIGLLVLRCSRPCEASFVSIPSSHRFALSPSATATTSPTSTVTVTTIGINNNNQNQAAPVLTRATTATTGTASASVLQRRHLNRLFSAQNSNDNNKNNNGDEEPSSSFVSNLSSALSNMRSLIPGSNSKEKAATVAKVVDAKLTELGMDWTKVREKLQEQQTTPEERNFRDWLEYGYGTMGSPLHKVRLYDESNKVEDIRVVFYRDSASWCPYCQKVWLTLEYKKIPYRIEKVNMRCYGEKPSTFTRLQPNGQIPVLILDGVVYRQSNDILEALEDAFPNTPSLRPLSKAEATTKGTVDAATLFRLERTLFSAWMFWLTSNGGERAKAAFVSVLNQVETSLSQAKGPFFMGSSLTMVDVQFAPFLERMAASLLYFKGFQIRFPPQSSSSSSSITPYPNINAWFDAMESLNAYRLTQSDYYTHCWDLPPQLGGCVSEPAGKPYELTINGKRSASTTSSTSTSSSSWTVPLEPHNGGIEPDWDNVMTPEEAKRCVVERLSWNANAIVKFASRGAGYRGVPGYSAPLADPNAVPNETVYTALHTCLSVLCMELLSSNEKLETDKKEATTTLSTVETSDINLMTQVANIIVQESVNAASSSSSSLSSSNNYEYANHVMASLEYLRDRVGVPRDMPYPAARQLRAYLNLMRNAIQDAISRTEQGTTTTSTNTAAATTTTSLE